MEKLAIAARGIALELDLSIGHIADLVIEAEGRRLRPLHRAPWIDEAATAVADWSPGTKGLSGDFLCAPFSASDVELAPLHGWPANSPWDVIENAAMPGGWRARLRLRRTVMGATLEKVLILRDGHPFLYQEHAFIGGEGELSAAHHPMTAMRAGGRIGRLAGARPDARALCTGLSGAHRGPVAVPAGRWRELRPHGLSGGRARGGFRHPGRGAA